MARLHSVGAALSAPKLPAAANGQGILGDCNFLHLLANSPAALKGYLAFAGALAHGHLSLRQRELVALAVAEINGSNYCLSAHYALARAAGLSEEEIRYARKATSADPQTDALLRFVQAVTLQRGWVNDADFTSLRTARFSEAQITEILAHIALNIFSNYFNSVVQTQVDFPVLKPGQAVPVST